jgi:hypothetical protein
MGGVARGKRLHLALDQLERKVGGRGFEGLNRYEHMFAD